jgi:hypothetical protein
MLGQVNTTAIVTSNSLLSALLSPSAASRLGNKTEMHLRLVTYRVVDKHHSDLLLCKITSKTFGEGQNPTVQCSASGCSFPRLQCCCARGQSYGPSRIDDVVFLHGCASQPSGTRSEKWTERTFPYNHCTPKLDAEQMLCVIQVQFFQLTANDLVDSRKDDMINGCEGFKRLDEGLFLSDISHDPRSVGRIESFDGILHSLVV